MAYLDEGPRDGEILLLMHGQPVWGYLYRRIIPFLLEAGHRVITPDLIGFGRSDKPIDQRYHTFDGQVNNLNRFLESLELNDITMLCQDWGSVIGLTAAGEQPQKFSRILLTNGALATWISNPFYIPEPVELDTSAPTIMEHMIANRNYQNPFPVSFQGWINYTLTAKNWNPEEMVKVQAMMGGRPVSEAEVAGYAAPFPPLIYKAGPRTFPSMICNIGLRTMRAWDGLRSFNKPFLHVRGTLDKDFGTEELQRFHTELIPGAADQPHTALEASHFIQDDKGEELAEILNHFIAEN